MTNGLGLECQVCGFVGLDDGSDGFFYCQRCGSQADGIRDTAVDDEEILLTKDNVIGIVQRRVSVVKPEPFSQSQPLSRFWESLRTQVDDDDDDKAGDGVGPTEPMDFGNGPSSTPRALSYEDYYSQIRMRYVMGIQIMIELQVKALVEKFNVCPIIVGMVEPIWLRFVASTKIFSDDWADEVINESESQLQGETEVIAPRAKHKAEPHNILGKRSVMIWFKSVSKTIPLSYSLAISFLVCHLAREPILSTDIAKWALEGKLPYFTAFLEIEKQFESSTNACPISSSRMFRPLHAVSIQRLESVAASIAHSIGLELPPVNFHGIAARYLGQLSLPVETILPHACRIYEWSMPPELWLSGNEFRLPTRACVLSILIVSIRILYKIHGFGKWEKGLSLSSNKRGDGKESDILDEKAESESESESECKMSPLSNNFYSEDYNKVAKQSNLDATEILLMLDSKYNELIDTSVDGKDLETYLEYCKNVVFAGVKLSTEDNEEVKIIEDLWDFYHKEEEDQKPSSPSPNCSPQKRPRDSSKSNTKKPKDEITKESHKEKEIRRMISNMEEKRFCYIPPRTKVKKPNDYLHYTRKKGEGNYTYAAHADYYILLRSCARVGRLDVRNLHGAVLSFERRLAWLEKNIDECVKQMPSNEEASCHLCQQDNVPDHDTMDFSKLNL